MRRNLFTKYFLSFLILIVVIFLWGSINYFASVYNARWDLTNGRQHTLTKSTQELLKRLPDHIRLTAFFVGIPPKYLSDLFKEYERASHGKVTAEIIDPIIQLGYAAQFGHYINVKENKVIAQSAQERRDVDFTDGLLSEESLNNAIMNLSRPKRYAYFLTGHGEDRLFDKGETGFTTLNKLLQENNIFSRELMLGGKDALPEDCNVLMIAGPKNNLTAKEEKMIEDYLEKGGHALFLIEHTFVTTSDKPLTEDEKQKNPSLNNILNQWGINVESDIVVDLASHASGDVGSPATRNYSTHKAIVSRLDYTFYVRPRSISMLDQRRASIQLAPLVLTASQKQSWAETNRNLQVKFDPGIDRAGPVPIAFVIWEPKKTQDVSDTRIIVFTDADFLSNNYINEYSNASMGLNVVNWLTEVDDKTITAHKDIKVKRLDLTSGQKRNIIFVLFLMPILIGGMGIFVWVRSKK